MSKKFFIDNLIDDYLVFLKDIKNPSDNSIKAYKRDILKFRNFLISNKINKLNDISEEICSSWIGSLYSMNIGARSIQRHLSSVCLLYTSPSPRDREKSRMPSSA